MHDIVWWRFGSSTVTHIESGGGALDGQASGLFDWGVISHVESMKRQIQQQLDG